MAIPTLNLATAASYRPTYQDYLSQQRQHEHESRQAWSNTAKYFNQSNVSCLKNDQWGSEASFNKSLDSFRDEQQKDDRKEELRRRRSTLKALLESEDAVYKIELQQISGSGQPVTLSSRVEDMRARVAELQSAREEKRRNVAQQKLYEHWRNNSPDIRQLESEQLQQHVVEGWSDQVIDKQQQRQEELRQKQLIEQQMEEERQRAVYNLQLQEQRKHRENLVAGDALVQQMNDLRAREQEAAELKAEQDRLLAEQWELEKLEEQRVKFEKERQKFELGRFLVQQYRAQLRRRFVQQRKERQEDIQLLEQIQQIQAREDQIKSEQQQIWLAEIQDMLDAARAKQEADKEMETELDMMYREEAERLWKKREVEWEREQNARKMLLDQVLAERATQVASKLSDVERAREESVAERERALLEMEQLKLEAEQEAYQTEEQKVARKDELQAQITARREAAISARLELEEELNRQREVEEQMKNLVVEERRVMTERGFQPKSYGILKQKQPTAEDETAASPRFDHLPLTPKTAVNNIPLNSGRRPQSSRRPHSNAQQRHFQNNIWGSAPPNQ